MRTRFIALAFAVASSSFFVASIAAAHGSERDRDLSDTSKTTVSDPEPGTELDEHSWEVRADFAVGAATTDIVTAGPPGPLEQKTANVFDSSRITTISLLLGLEHEITERITVGARMPFVEGNIASRDGFLPSRNGQIVGGNLEFEGTYKLPLGKYTLHLTMEVALPTGGGVDQPSMADIAANPTQQLQYDRLDKAGIMRAASWSRGSLDSALFEPGRLGLIPKASMPIHVGKLTVTPMIKVENLFDVTGDASQSYVGEIVGALSLAYRVNRFVEPGLSAWTNIVYTTQDINDEDVIVLNPFVKFHTGPVQPFVGAVIPVLGHLWTDKAFSVDFGASAEF